MGCARGDCGQARVHGGPLRGWVASRGAMGVYEPVRQSPGGSGSRCWKRENRELRQTDEVLRKASAYFRWRSSTAGPKHDRVHGRSSCCLRGRGSAGFYRRPSPYHADTAKRAEPTKLSAPGTARCGRADRHRPGVAYQLQVPRCTARSGVSFSAGHRSSPLPSLARLMQHSAQLARCAAGTSGTRTALSCPSPGLQNSAANRQSSGRQ